MNSFLRSVSHAWAGVRLVYKEERNFRIEIGCAILAFIFAILLQFSATEFAVVSLVIGLVLAAEIMNSVLERTVDVLKPRVSSYAKIAKDLVAGMVLVAAISSVLVALFLYVPKLIYIFSL